MKTEKATIPFYTTILATLLKEWREQNHISIYAIAKIITASPHTITRFEQLQGGISFEVGLRYLEYAETHISHPNIFGKFRAAIAQHRTEKEQQLYLIDLEHKEQFAMRQRLEEQNRIEECVRKSVTEEIEKKHISDIRLLNNEKQMLTDKIAKLEQENAALRNEKSDLSSDCSSKSTWFSKFKDAF